MPGKQPTRREQQRLEMIKRIKDSARALLTPHHSGELSLRAVARDVGVAPSGIYRYFASRQELVASLAGDACDSAQAAMDEVVQGVWEEAPAAGDQIAQAVALAHAYRRWCLGHRAEFSLLFATELASGADKGEALAAAGALHPFFGAPLEHYLRGIRTGVVETSAAVLPEAPGLSATAEAMRAAHAPALSAQEVAVLVWGWASLHGFISLEVFGPLTAFYPDTDSAYDRHVRAVLASMGYLDLSPVE